MVEQLLDLSRMEAEGASLDLSEFPARRLLDRARDEAVLSAGNGIAIDVEASPPGLRIVADEVRMQQVVTNLIDNAVRHSPAGRPVTARMHARGTAVRLDVCDLGPGIPPDQRSRVFERFYRADDSRSSSGAGLGLSIAQWVVSMHGGSIAATDAEPSGCRMVVELPGAVRIGGTGG